MIISISRSNLMANHLWNHAALLAVAADHGTRFLDPALDPWATEFPRFRNDPTGGGCPLRWPAGLTAEVHRAAVRLGPRLAPRLRRWSATGRLPGWAAFVETGWRTTLTDPDGVVHVDRPPFAELIATKRLLLVHGPLFRYADGAAFAAHRQRVVDALRPAPAVTERARAATVRARRGRATLIGIHVRRGDYAGYLGGRYFYEWSTYERIMAEVVATWGGDDVAFLVTSSEPAPSGFARDLTWSPGPGDEVGDLAALSRCDLLIGPPSTYSHWASFVGGAPRWILRSPDERPHPDGFVPA